MITFELLRYAHQLMGKNIKPDTKQDYISSNNSEVKSSISPETIIVQ